PSPPMLNRSWSDEEHRRLAATIDRLLAPRDTHPAPVRPVRINAYHSHGEAPEHCHPFTNPAHLKIAHRHSAQTYADSPVVRKAIDAGYKTSRSGSRPATKDGWRFDGTKWIQDTTGPRQPAHKPQRAPSGPDWGSEPTELS